MELILVMVGICLGVAVAGGVAWATLVDGVRSGIAAQADVRIPDWEAELARPTAVRILGPVLHDLGVWVEQFVPAPRAPKAEPAVQIVAGSESRQPGTAALATEALGMHALSAIAGAVIAGTVLSRAAGGFLALLGTAVVAVVCFWLPSIYAGR